MTPLYRYIGINDPLPIELPTIVRFDRDPATGQWILGPNLSTPQWSRDPNTLLGSASIHTYPALSPSGQGLAYFSIILPDASTGTQPWTSRVAIANADGSGATILASFNPGFVPTGLTWTTDGSAIIVSVSQQVNFGSGYIPAPLRSKSAIFSISTADGSATEITALGNGIAPMLPLIQAPSIVSANTPISLTRGSSGNMVFRATGIPDSTMVTLQSSQDGLKSFGNVQQVSGAQLNAGFDIPINQGQGSRFFRLAD